MVVEPYLQWLDDLPEPGGGGDVVSAGTGCSRRVIMRQYDAPGVKIEGAADRPAQRDQALCPSAAGVEVFGDVDALAIKIEDLHALLAPATQSIDEVAPELG